MKARIAASLSVAIGFAAVALSAGQAQANPISVNNRIVVYFQR